MPAVRTRLLSWAPSGTNDQDVDIQYPQRPFPNLPSPNDCETVIPDLSAHSSPSLSHNSSRNSVTSASSPEISHTPLPSHSTTLPERTTRSGNSTWVARPRNKFIIFRCQFSKEHAKESLKGPQSSAPIPEKTLSKRASEAWSRLPEEEKKRYELLAEIEKREHQRKNPDYRFQPKKRQPDAKRRKIRRVPSLTAFCKKLASTSRIGEVKEPLAVIVPPMSSTSRDRVEEEKPKAPRRRSASAPQVYNSCTSYPMYPPIQQTPQRSTSLVMVPPASTNYQRYSVDLSQSIALTPRPTIASFFVPALPYTSSSRETIPSFQPDYDLIRSQSNDSRLNPQDAGLSTPPLPPMTTNTTDESSRPQHASPLTAVASSLINWNGEQTAPSTPHAVAPASFWPSTIPEGLDFVAGDQLPTPPVLESQTESIATYDYQDRPWGSTPTDPVYPTFQFGIPTSQQPTLTSFEELERTQALHEYDIGLTERLGNDFPVFGSQDDGTDTGSLHDFDLASLFPEYY